MENDNVKFKIFLLFISIILLVFLCYKFIYIPLFTIGGKINREVKLEIKTEKKTLFYGCSLPKENILFKKIADECKRRGYLNKTSLPDCTPDYMGGCN
jgi:hypothetical protein